MTDSPSALSDPDHGRRLTPSLHRARRIASALLGSPAVVDVLPGTASTGAQFGTVDPLDDRDDGDTFTPWLLATFPGARAYGVIPCASPDASGSELSVWIVSGDQRAWSDDERRALTHLASAVAADRWSEETCSRLSGEIAALRQDAMRDPLTALANRAMYLDRLGHAVERARRHRDFRFAVLLVDLDRFKTINDSLGVEVGDQLLVSIAARLVACVRDEDSIARLSGDEYAVLLESLADDSDAGRVAERMLRALAIPVLTQEGELFPSASIGIALSSSGLDDGKDAHVRLLQRAGVAMSRAKAGGRGRYEMFDRAMQARAVARLRMETDLRAAVERQEFELYYQPLVSLETGKITEFEALLRWRHPVRGLVAPLDFIPLAEETGLITRIGTWVLADACRQMSEWQARFPRDCPLSLSVNVSVRQFAQADFVRHVSDIVRASGLDPRALKLEITESVAIDDPERTRGMLEELRSFGVRMYLDDFGTGYSSLGHLHQLSLDAIKIDRSFVMHMDQPVHLQLVHTVRDLARNIGVTVIAEGVETQAQLDVLRHIGCESAQGYLFSRPVPIVEVANLLERDPVW